VPVFPHVTLVHQQVPVLVVVIIICLMELVSLPVLSGFTKIKLPSVVLLASRVATHALRELPVLHVALVVSFLEIVLQVVRALNISSKLPTPPFVGVFNVSIHAILAQTNLLALPVFKDSFLTEIV